MRPVTLLLAMLAVALPWYALVGIRTHGQWLDDFFWEHNVQRFMEPREGHHGLLLFPPLTLMGCFFPWSLLLPVALAAGDSANSPRCGRRRGLPADAVVVGGLDRILFDLRNEAAELHSARVSGAGGSRRSLDRRLGCGSAKDFARGDSCRQSG